MKEAFVNTSINYLKKNNVCNSKQEKIFKYTLESLYSFFTKSFIILLLSMFLHTFLITLLTLLLYSILRGFTFGIHAQKNIHCWIISLTIYILFPFLINNYVFPDKIIYSFYVIGIIAILLWAPADTKARPLINKRKRIANKIISLLLSIILIWASFLLKIQNFKEITCTILFLNSICTCPITYYIFRQPYRNYRFYKKN